MVIKNSKIHICHSCIDSYQNNRTSFSCIFNCLSHSDVISCTVINNICFIRSKAFYHCLTKIMNLCIVYKVNSTLLCLFQTHITDVCHHNTFCTHGLCCLCNQISNWSCTKYSDFQSLYVPCTAYGMAGYRCRFYHRSFIIIHCFRKVCYLTCIYGKIV